MAIRWRLTIKQKCPNLTYHDEITLCSDGLAHICQLVDRFENQFGDAGLEYKIESEVIEYEE